MSTHIIMVRSTGALHLMDRLFDMTMNLVEVPPVPDSFRRGQGRRHQHQAGSGGQQNSSHGVSFPTTNDSTHRETSRSEAELRRLDPPNRPVSGGERLS